MVAIFRVAIVEDSIEEAAEIKSMLERFGKSSKEEFDTVHYPSAMEFLSQRGVFDLIFMDIKMPGINGMEAAEMLRVFDENVPLVFVTSLARLAAKGYAVNAADFIVKPVSYLDFSRSMARVLRLMRRRAGLRVAIPTSNGLRVVSVSSVIYFDIQRHYLSYHLEGGETLRVRKTMQDAVKDFPSEWFVRISSSCTVNMGHIGLVRKDHLVMTDGTELYFSRPKKSAALATIAQFLGRSI